MRVKERLVNDRKSVTEMIERSAMLDREILAVRMQLAKYENESADSKATEQIHS
jgi:hypothetical protein